MLISSNFKNAEMRIVASTASTLEEPMQASEEPDQMKITHFFVAKMFYNQTYTDMEFSKSRTLPFNKGSDEN